MQNNSQYIGADIAKTNFVADVGEKPRRFDNTPEGYEAFMAALPERGWVVCESTGGYEQGLVGALQARAIKVSVVMPVLVRHYARSQNIMAKNDSIDARMLSIYGRASAEKLREHRESRPAEKKLRELTQARCSLVEMLKLEANLQEHAGRDPMLAKQARERVELVEKQIKQIEQAIRAHIDSDQELAQRARRCAQIKGVGEVTTWTLLGHMPELGELKKGQAANLLGVAPLCNQSGERSKPRHVRGGRPAIRKVVYMAALSAARTNPVLSVVYQRLRASGKPLKLALVAIMRKLIELINRLFADPNFFLAH